MDHKKPRVPLETKRGRPRTVCREQETGSTVTSYLPAAYHDRLVSIAQQRQISVSTLVRNLLILRLPTG